MYLLIYAEMIISFHKVVNLFVFLLLISANLLFIFFINYLYACKLGVIDDGAALLT